MIAGLVEFDLPSDMTRDRLLALYRASAQGWVTNQELVEKIYFFDGERRRGGGVYLWPSLEAAHRNLGEAYIKRIRETYGAVPRIRFLDSVLRVEPGARGVLEI